MLHKKVLPASVPEEQRDELVRSWKVRGFAITFGEEECESLNRDTNTLRSGTTDPATQAVLNIAADEQRVAAIAQAEQDAEPTKEPVVEEPTKEPVVEEKSSNVPDDLKCPHCGSTARTPASYEKNHGDNCYQKKD